MDPVIAKHSQRLAAIPDLEDLTFGVPSGFFWENCSPGIAEAVERALRSLEKAGARLVRFDLSGLDEIFEVFLIGGVAAPDLVVFIRGELADVVPDLDPNWVARLRTAEELSDWEYI